MKQNVNYDVKKYSPIDWPDTLHSFYAFSDNK